MSNEKYGEYDFKGYSIINAFINDENEAGFTAIHESMHAYLTENTPYGDLGAYIDNLSKINKKYEHTGSILFKKMENMQETLAYFYEFLIFKYSNDDHEFKLKLKNLKKENKQNYNRLVKVSYLLDLAVKKDEDYIDIINLVKVMGVFSLTFWFPKISIEQIQNVHKFTAYLKLNKIDPNSKFIEVNNFVKKEFKKNKEINKVTNALLKEYSKEKLGWEKEFREVLNEDVKHNLQKQNFPMLFENLRSVVLKDPETGKEVNFVENRSEFDFVGVGSGVPYSKKQIGLDQFMDVISREWGSLYIYACYNRPNVNIDEYFVVFRDIKKGIEFILKDSQINITGAILKQLIDNVGIYNGVIVMPPAYNQYTINILKFSEKTERNKYVYIDFPYAFSRKLLKHYLDSLYKDNKQYPGFIVEYQNFWIVAVQIDEKYIILTPIFALSKSSFLDDLESKYLNIKILDLDSDNVHVNKDALELIDTMVFSTMYYDEKTLINYNDVTK